MIQAEVPCAKGLCGRSSLRQKSAGAVANYTILFYNVIDSK